MQIKDHDVLCLDFVGKASAGFGDGKGFRHVRKLLG
jgi:hypothetical protein